MDAKQPQKVVVFYRYLFDERYLKEAVRDDWLKLYDKEVGGVEGCWCGTGVWDAAMAVTNRWRQAAAVSLHLNKRGIV